jgi:transcriptional regulator with XRE-family HTH domain
MARGQAFEDFLSEELAGDEQLAAEVRDAFDDMRLPVQLCMAREARGMSQQALSLASGVTQPMISRIERGDQQPKWPTIRRLVAALGAELVLRPDGTVHLRGAVRAESAAPEKPAVGNITGRTASALRPRASRTTGPVSTPSFCDEAEVLSP